MTVVEVKEASHINSFLNLVDSIYKNDPNYIRPLDAMIEEVFDPSKNSLFATGSAVRYLLVDGNRPVGRIAAFVNGQKAYGYDQPTGGIGFFECVNNQDAAFMLFDVAHRWLKNKGMEAMDGPINFGENVNFWGLLVEGFTPPGFGMQYNPSYYREFFEAYGFEVYYEQITNHLDLKAPFPERFWRIAERALQKPGLEFRHFRLDELDKFVADFIEIYNQAWKFHEGFVPMQEAPLRAVLQKSKSFIMEELIWYAYSNGKPIAFLVMFPDANQILRHFNGKLNWWNKFQFVYYKWRKEMTRIRVTVLGVIPEFQRSGIESCLFYKLRDEVLARPHLNEMELSWVGDFNPKMRALQEAMGASFAKRHITYRYMFNPDLRGSVKAPIIPVDTKFNG
jgi:hypothetical protein